MNWVDLLVASTILLGVSLYAKVYINVKRRHREDLDDVVDFDDWKSGNVNDPLPPDAERFDPLAVYDGEENLGRLKSKK